MRGLQDKQNELSYRESLTGSQTPLQYLKALKKGVPSCANIPLE